MQLINGTLINHHWYLFGKDGYMLTDWRRWNGADVIGLNDPGDWYFLDNTVDGPLEGHAGTRWTTEHR